MNLLETVKVKVGNLVFPIKITNRAMIQYEKLSGGSVSTIKGHENFLQLFYCAAQAGAKSDNIEFTYTYDQFLDAIDDYYKDALSNFSKALAESGGEGKKLQVKK